MLPPRPKIYSLDQSELAEFNKQIIGLLKKKDSDI